MAATRARMEADWWHTASVLCQVANLHRGKGEPEKDVYAFHPFAVKPKPKPRPATEEDLRMLFG